MKCTSVLLLSSLVLIFNSCNTDFVERSMGSEEDLSYPGVDSELHVHFQQFEAEATKRGYTISLADLEITGVITEIEEEGIAGTCNFGNHVAHVTVDQSFWNTASEPFQEYVVFHELGHCALLRGHSEGSNKSGECQSIMASGTQDCRVNYSNNRRDQLIDELFESYDF